MLKIEDTGITVIITLYSPEEMLKKIKPIMKELSDRQKKILSFLKRKGRITTSQCASLINSSQDTALRELTKLKEMKLIQRKGIGRSIYYTL